MMMMMMMIKHLRVIPRGVTPAGALNTGGVYKFRDFRPTTLFYIYVCANSVCHIVCAGDFDQITEKFSVNRSVS